MEKYTNAKSTLVKTLIKTTDFNHRHKIDELLELESFILNSTNSHNAKEFFESLKKKYPNEYAEIFQELKSEDIKLAELEGRRKKEEKEREERFWKEKEERLAKEEG
ncbi:MAG: hypothetical protein M1348_01365 [Candidatus Parvarchaeota archaeon]|nr:hypothetical protein [Candidatus Parvarchaeota archaeon]